MFEYYDKVKLDFDTAVSDLKAMKKPGRRDAAKKPSLMTEYVEKEAEVYSLGVLMNVATRMKDEAITQDVVDLLASTSDSKPAIYADAKPKSKSKKTS